MTLKEKAMKMNSGNGIAFMQGKTKGETEEILNQNLTIVDYDFISDEDGDYAVFVLNEAPDKFFFGGSVLTKNLKEFTTEEKEKIKSEGLPVLFSKRKNKNGKREYTAVEFFPDETSSEDLPF